MSILVAFGSGGVVEAVDVVVGTNDWRLCGCGMFENANWGTFCTGGGRECVPDILGSVLSVPCSDTGGNGILGPPERSFGATGGADVASMGISGE